MAEERLHAYISGWVQGVGFRWWTIQTVRKMGSIKGWVRNLPDGRVELVAEATREKLDDLVLRLYTGPPSSRVNEVKTEYMQATGQFGGFDVRY